VLFNHCKIIYPIIIDFARFFFGDYFL